MEDINLAMEWFQSPNATVVAERQIAVSIIAAAKSGDGNKLQQLIEYWSGNPVMNAIDTTDETRKTALMWSSWFGFQNCVWLLCRGNVISNSYHQNNTHMLIIKY